MRPHGDPGLAGGQGQQGLAACGGLERAGDQHDPRGRAVAGPEGAGLGEGAHQAQQGTVVLGGEHLGGRHQGGLAAGVHDLQHRPQGHERLARAHVPLQQPAHRGVPGQLGGQLLPHRHLAGRQRERQAGVQGLEQAPGPRRAGHGGHRPLPVPAPGERGLDEQRLTQGQRGPRRAGGGDVVRGVQVPVRLGGARQRRVQVERRGGLRADPLGEQLGDPSQVDGLEHPGDGGADRPRRQLPRGPVERDRSHVHLPRGDVVVQEGEVRVVQRDPAAVLGRAALEHGGHPGGEAAAGVVAVEEGHGQARPRHAGHGRVRDGDVHDEPGPAVHAPRGHRLHDGDDGHLGVVGQRGDGGELAALDPAARHVVQQVPDRGQPELLLEAGGQLPAQHLGQGQVGDGGLSGHGTRPVRRRRRATARPGR